MIKNNEKLKRISIAGISFCFMISIAGYINYKYNPEREKDLGQTVYVNSSNDEVNIYKEAGTVFNNKEKKISLGYLSHYSHILVYIFYSYIICIYI